MSNLATNNLACGGSLTVTGSTTFSGPLNSGSSASFDTLDSNNLSSNLSNTNELTVLNKISVLGSCQYVNQIPVCSLVAIDNDQLITKKYVDNKITTILASDNSWTANNTFSNLNVNGASTFNNQLPTSTIIPLNDNQLTNKKFVDTNVNSLLSRANKWIGSSNVFTSNLYASYFNVSLIDMTGTMNFIGQGVFNTLLPISSLVPSTDDHLCNKKYIDTKVDTLSSLNNTWSGTNTFNNAVMSSFKLTTTDVTVNGLMNFTNYLPSCSKTAVVAQQLCNKAYTDARSSFLISQANIWSLVNTFPAGIIVNDAYLTTLSVTGLSSIATMQVNGNANFSFPVSLEKNLSCQGVINADGGLYSKRSAYINISANSFVPSYSKISMTAGVWFIGLEGHCMPIFSSQPILSYIWLSGKPSLILVNPGYSIQIFNQINNIGTSFTCTNNEVANQKLYRPNTNYVFASCTIQTLDINGSYQTIGLSMTNAIDI